MGIVADFYPGQEDEVGPYRQSERLDIYNKYIAPILNPVKSNVNDVKRKKSARELVKELQKEYKKLKKKIKNKELNDISYSPKLNYISRAYACQVSDEKHNVENK